MYTREQWATAFLHAIGNGSPHPYMVKWVVAWTEFETGSSEIHAFHNLLNTTEGGYGSNFLSVFNSVGVKQFPCFEDGVAANAAALIGGPNYYYPQLLEALRNNHGEHLQQPTQEIASELNTWGTGLAADIAALANSGNVRALEPFPGRHAGQP